MIKIRASGVVIASNVPAFTLEMSAKLTDIRAFTEFESDESVLDGRYSAAALRTIADAMDWHRENEQRPIEMVSTSEKCASCGGADGHDAFISGEITLCFRCGYSQAAAA